MPRVVPSDAPKACATARAFDAFVKLPKRKGTAVAIAEDVLAAQVLDSPKRLQQRAGQRHVT